MLWLTCHTDGDRVLEDLLRPGLRLLICGSAVGAKSAARGAYYAGPGNKFWTVLYEVGLTPRRLTPPEYRDLLLFGIGLTDVVKQQSGSDAEIDFKRSEVSQLRERVLELQPAILAFNGKKAALVFSGNPRIEFGRQENSIGVTRLFVAPSTSGAANGYWDIHYWQELGRLARKVASAADSL